MNKEKRTFAYILLACKLTQELKSELSEYYWGGIIEAFISCEEQAIAPEGLYPFGWESIMNRVAPVQMTNGWDPRRNFLGIYSGKPVRDVRRSESS